MKSLKHIGIVIIGRNEGQRLIDCIKSVKSSSICTVYVDSNSDDKSVENAQKLGAYVVNLDLSIPFTAARARNEGFEKLLAMQPEVEYVQFIDGDCQLATDWLPVSTKFLNENTDYALVCGRRKELNPDKSKYNLLCDIEWDTPIGEAKSCGGDFLIRTKVFDSIDGFNPTVIAGEEPEMCFRLRHAGFRIYRIDHDMTLHDANITKLSQWWKRSVRCGHAYLEGAFYYGSSKERFRVKQCMSALIWGLILPLSIIFLSLMNSNYLWLFLLYPGQITRLWFRHKNKPIPSIQALMLVLSKFSEVQGMMLYLTRYLLRRTNTIIEYK